MKDWVIATRHGDIDMRRRTAVMGIVNVTPDSFSDGGQYFDPERAISHGSAMAGEGADIVDIGGESTRPGAAPVSSEEEWARVGPVLRGLRRAVSIPLSVDTVKAGVAERALEAGADLINDVSALRFDPDMAGLAARERVPVVLMHMQGTPRTMQQDPQYRDVVQEVKSFLAARADFALRAGIDPERIIIDPGIGFGKSLDHNLALLRSLADLAALPYPLLVGPSRKTFLGTLLQAQPRDRLEGTLAAVVAAALGGASMVRVHDVRETVRALRVADALHFGVDETQEKSQ